MVTALNTCTRCGKRYKGRVSLRRPCEWSPLCRQCERYVTERNERLFYLAGAASLTLLVVILARC